MTTILTICQDAAREVGFDVPSTIVGNSDPTAMQLMALLNREGQELARRAPWTKLQVEHLFTTTNGSAAYALPSDFDRFIDETQWDRLNHWPLIGPVTPQEWQLLKSGVITTFPQRRFRLKGASSTTYYLDPTPSTTGDTLVFEYICLGWVTAATWVTATSYSAGVYASYNGNRYYTSAGGTSGVTPPTWTSGSSSDGGVTWEFVDHGADRIIADTDQVVLDYKLLSLGLVWRFLEAKGLDFTAKLLEYKNAVSKAIARDGGARTLMMTGYPWFQFIGPWNVRDGNYGS